MIRDICKDEFFLSLKAEPATADDLGVAQDLLDTLTAHRNGYVGITGASSRSTTTVHTWSCSTRRSSKNPRRMTRRRAACH